MTEEVDNSDAAQGSIKMGWILIVVGLIVILFSFMYDVGVSTYNSGGLYGIPSRVANTDKMAIRQMLHLSGVATFIVGSITLAAGQVVSVVHSAK